MSGLRIRRATSADAGTLAGISRDTFVETFGHLYAPEDLAWHLDFSYAPEKYRDALDEQGAVAWMLEDEADAVQGYAFAGPCGLPHGDVQPGDLELKRLYLRRSLQNGGWGARLFAEAEDWMRRMDALAAYSLHCAARKLDDSVIATAQAAGIPVLCFTVNDRQDAEALLARGVTAVFSDRIDSLRGL